MTAQASTKRHYFAEPSATAAFDQALVEHVAAILKAFVSQLLPPENTQRLRHGGDWKHPGLPSAIDGGMQNHSSLVAIEFQDLINHDIGAIDRHVRKITDDMSKQFQQMMYQTVSAACDASGNVVSTKAEGGPLEAFAAMLEKIQFSADKDGKVSQPQLHLSSEMLNELRDAEKTAAPELLQRIEDTRTRKTTEAIEEERRRKERFIRYGSSA